MHLMRVTGALREMLKDDPVAAEQAERADVCKLRKAGRWRVGIWRSFVAAQRHLLCRNREQYKQFIFKVLGSLMVNMAQPYVMIYHLTPQWRPPYFAVATREENACGTYHHDKAN